MNDPVVHDQALNEAFRSDIPKKPEPEPTSDSDAFSWLEVVPKFKRLRGVQITADNHMAIGRLHGWNIGVYFAPGHDGTGVPYLTIPSTNGDVKAFPDDWIMIADDNWDQVTVCSKEAFTRTYEVKSDG